MTFGYPGNLDNVFNKAVTTRNSDGLLLFPSKNLITQTNESNNKNSKLD